MTIVVFAPNWLGDAVMTLPALADVRRFAGTGQVIVAARRSVASLFALVPGVDRVVELGPSGGLLTAWRGAREDASAVRAVAPSAALLFPNSIHSAMTARLAGVPERWGYRRDGRGLLLTRAIRPLRSIHQVDAYRHLVAAVGMTNGPREPRLDLAPTVIDEARVILQAAGWNLSAPIVGFAPGAAFGGAKRWPPARVAAVMARVIQERDAVCVMVGAAADAGTVGEVAAHLDTISGPAARGHVVNLVGKTTLAQLAGVMAVSRVFVSNDSGAMHLAAAVGTPVVAMFGPTNERATAPVPRPETTAAILVGSAWCRPCGLRECPFRQGCLTSIAVDRVYQAVSERL
jgi:heptosyltransferase II